MDNVPRILRSDLGTRRPLSMTVGGAMLFAVALVTGAHIAPRSIDAPAVAQQSAKRLPMPPPNGEMGFVIDNFAPAFLPDPEACPDGPALKTRDVFLQSLPPDERARLLDPANQAELDERWQESLRRHRNVPE